MFYTVTMGGDPQNVNYTVPVTTRPTMAACGGGSCPGKGCGRRVRRSTWPQGPAISCADSAKIDLHIRTATRQDPGQVPAHDPEALLALMQGMAPDRERLRAAMEFLDRDTRWLSDLGEGDGESLQVRIGTVVAPVD